MELVDRHLPDPLTPPGTLSGTLPPFTDLDDPWAQNDLFDFDHNSYYPESNIKWEEDCDCGGPPPPLFNLPPPPPPPIQEVPLEGSGEILYMGGKPKSEVFKSKKGKNPPQIKWDVSPSQKDPKDGNCEDTPPSPQDACPALLIAGDAHVRPRLHPPIAALLVAAATFAFVIGIAAVVCWRFRKQRNRPGSTKSTTDLTNGVIYDDLPSGPTPRGLTAHGHDTCTLAPMELLDLKLASHLHTASFADPDRGPCHILMPSNTSIKPTTTSTAGVISNTNTINSFHHCPNPYSLGSPQKTLRKDFSFSSRSPTDTHRNADFICSQQNPCNVEDIRFSPTKYKDFIRADYSEPAGKRIPLKSSQELYNPTYEEISTGSDSTSVSSGSSSKKHSLPRSSRGLISPSEEPPGSWSPTPCACAVKGPPSSRRDSRSRRQKPTQDNAPGSTFIVREYPEDPPSLIYGVPPPIPPPTLYTIPGTSDGRTSTSSSSDQPPERGREARYYVGVQLPSSVRSPGTPPEGYAPPCLATPSVQYGLPPLPSRSDRYRIFFTTDRKRGLNPLPQADSKTLDSASRRRNRTKEFSSTTESEPLYHEL